jgi:hypothetical protein
MRSPNESRPRADPGPTPGTEGRVAFTGEGPSSPLMSAALPSHKCEARSNIGGGETIPGER